MYKLYVNTFFGHHEPSLAIESTPSSRGHATSSEGHATPSSRGRRPWRSMLEYQKTWTAASLRSSQ